MYSVHLLLCAEVLVCPKYNIVQHDMNYMAGKVIFQITISVMRLGCHVVLKFLGGKLSDWIHLINSFSSYVRVYGNGDAVHDDNDEDDALGNLLIWNDLFAGMRNGNAFLPQSNFLFLIKSYQPQKGLVNRDISRESWFNAGIMYTFSFWVLLGCIYCGLYMFAELDPIRLLLAPLGALAGLDF